VPTGLLKKQQGLFFSIRFQNRLYLLTDIRLRVFPTIFIIDSLMIVVNNAASKKAGSRSRKQNRKQDPAFLDQQII
jgi:hypothetical protein